MTSPLLICSLLLVTVRLLRWFVAPANTQRALPKPGGVAREQAVGLPGIPGLPEGSSIYALYAYIVTAFAVGAPKLYLHMIRQRKKQLGGGGGKTKAS